MQVIGFNKPDQRALTRTRLSFHHSNARARFLIIEMIYVFVYFIQRFNSSYLIWSCTKAFVIRIVQDACLRQSFCITSNP
jgi:hypothetical protein